MIFCCYLTESIVNLYNNAKTDLAFIDQSPNTILKAFDINIIKHFNSHSKSYFNIGLHCIFLLS